MGLEPERLARSPFAIGGRISALEGVERSHLVAHLCVTPSGINHHLRTLRSVLANHLDTTP